MNKSDRFLRSRSFQESGLSFSLSKDTHIPLVPSKDRVVSPSDLLFKFITTKPKSDPQDLPWNISPLKLSKSRHHVFEHSPIRSFVRKLAPNKKRPKILSGKELHTVELFGVRNDFYAQMVDSLGPSLAVFGLMERAILYDFESEKFLRPLESEFDPKSLPINSIHCNLVFNNILAFGSDRGSISIIDVTRGKPIKIWGRHTSRIGALKFHPNRPRLIASGSKDRNVFVSDMRLPNRTKSAFKLKHNGEVCGLSWQPRGHCLASGGNNNEVCVWDIRRPRKILLSITQHTAAVRALEFSPLDSALLASGGGAGDSVLRICNIKRPREPSLVIKTQSQICSLLWDSLCNRVLTSHGFSKYQLCLWDLETESLVSEYFGHKNRILDVVRMKQSKKVLSFSPDHQAKVWNCFKEPFKRRNNLLTPMKIR